MSDKDWVMVPADPTEEMLDVFSGNKKPHPNGTAWGSYYQSQYQKLIAAAPTQPSAPVQQSVPALRDAMGKLIELAAQIARRRNMPDTSMVEHSVNVPKKTWRSINRMNIRAYEQCCDWANDVRKIADNLSTIITLSTSTSPLLDKNDQKEGEKVEFLLDGARFKLSFHQDECPHCGEMLDDYIVRPLEQYREELNGQWVALVPAENDRHLKFTAKPPQPPAEAGEGAVAEVCYTSHPYKDCVIVWIGQDKPEIGTKLYTSQTTATQAAVAAAMREGYNKGYDDAIAGKNRSQD